MSGITSQWWPDERVDATVSLDYIHRTLDPSLHTRLNRYLSFGENLTDDTYIDWILERARKLYLILLELNLPDRIFHLIDNGYDDADLPITSRNTANLRLSPLVKGVFANPRFAQVQEQFLVRTVPEGGHVTYGEEETIPLEPIRKKIFISLPDSVQTDKVVYPGAVCRELLRVKVTFEPSHVPDQKEILREIRALRPFAHEHIVSIFGSYTVGSTVNVLLSGTPECTLELFLKDRPSTFKQLSKDEQHLIMVNWPHCLANGLAWIHAQGQQHGAIRPSNILIDSENRIFLGFFELFSPLIPQKGDSFEAYQYSAPEQNQNPLSTVPTTYPASRPATARRDISQPNTSGWPAGSPFSRSPMSQPKRQSRISLGRSTSSSSNSSSSHSSVTRRNISSLASQSSMSTSSTGYLVRTAPNSAFPPKSAGSIYSVSENDTRRFGGRRVSAVLVHSHGQASDIFSLAAVCLDILTCFCKKKQSTFISHRSARNRTAHFGGMIPDASFHSTKNAEQILSWIVILEREAAKQKSSFYRAVSPLLAVVRDMLSRNPENRPPAVQVVARYARAICSVSNEFKPHCRFEPGVLSDLRTVDTHDDHSLGARHGSSSTLSSGMISNYPLTPDPSTETHHNGRAYRRPDPASRTPSSCYSLHTEENDNCANAVPQDQYYHQNPHATRYTPSAIDIDVIDDEEIGLSIDMDAGIKRFQPDIPLSRPSPPLTPTKPYAPWPSSNLNISVPGAKPLKSPTSRDRLIPAPLSLVPPRPAPPPTFSPPPVPISPFSPTSACFGRLPPLPPTPKEYNENWSTRSKIQRFPRPPMSSFREGDVEQPMRTQLDSGFASLNDNHYTTGYTNFSRHRGSFISR